MIAYSWGAKRPSIRSITSSSTEHKSAPPPKPSQQIDKIGRKRSFQAEPPVGRRMPQRQPVRVQCLPAERDGARGCGTLRVAIFCAQCSTAQPCRDSELVAQPGAQAHLDQRGLLDRLDHLVLAGGLGAFLILRMRFLLNERSSVPDEEVTPRPL